MTSPDTADSPELLRSLLQWARVIFTPLSLLVIALFIWQARATLGATLESGSWSRLLPVIMLWMAGHMLAPLISVYIFKSCGVQLSYRTALHIHCSRLPAKYLPGGIWHSVGRANDYFDLGHEGRRIGSYFILENFLLVAVTLGMSAGIVAPLVAMQGLQLLIGLLPLFMALALLLFPVMAKLLMKNFRPLAPGAYCVAVLLLFAYWCLLGFTFACYISAFGSLNLENSPVEIGGIYVFSWCLGYLALFAPQGIGVAEFISGTLLGGGRAAELLAFLIGFRVLVLVADLVTWGIAVVMKTKR